jgi:uncharacterized protein involved in exopolysaccharide biosynthesis
MAHLQREIPVLEPRTHPDFPSNGGGPGSPEESGETLARLQLLWENRRVLLRFALWGLAAAAVVAFLIPSKYESVTQLMPPDNSTSGMSMLATLAASKAAGTGAGSDALTGFAGDILGAKSSGALFVGVVRSRTVQDALINQFDLRKVYWIRRMEDTRKELDERTTISEERKSGIITIKVRDHSPRRAQAMAQAYVEQLNIAMAKLSTSSARREREFLETRLKAVKQDLDAASQDFSQFASKNTAIDIPEQGKAMVEAAAMLQGQLIAAEAHAQGLEQMYTANNARVRAAQANIDELRRQLDKMGGAGATTDNPGQEAALYPSIRQLPLLGVKYADLYRRTKIQEAVFEILTKQYELAKVEEAKEIPTVRLLDPASYPEKVASPHRIIILLAGLLLFFALGCVWVVGSAKWQDTDEQEPRKLFALEVWAGARRDWSALRRRVALRLAKGNRNGRNDEANSEDEIPR